jgi:CheY-like chemotaxis protein
MPDIMVVDRDALSREQTRTVLRKAGHTVTAIAKPGEALSRLEETPTDWDLLFSDGEDLFRAIYLSPVLRAPLIPCVITTCEGREQFLSTLPDIVSDVLRRAQNEGRAIQRE